MSRPTTTLDQSQQDLVAIVKAAHQNLALARKLRSGELARRLAEDKVRIEREIARSAEIIKMDLDAEIAQHEVVLDESLIAAYDGGVPIRRIALDGFGNRYDGGVTALLMKLREEGRIGTREGHQRNTTDPDDLETTVEFPKPVDVDALIEAATDLREPTYTLMDEPLELVAAHSGDTGVYADAVYLQFDPRDPWFKQIAKNMRPGTPFAKETGVTLYIHPFSGDLTTWESREEGETLWDHPVARWVKTHAVEARAGFDAALNS